MMGPPCNRNLKRTHSLFIDDLNLHQQNHEKLKMVNETIVKASQDTGVCYGVKKCAKIVFNSRRMVKVGLDVLAERMNALEPKQNKNYNFLGCEQAEQLDTDAVYRRVKAELDKKMKALTSTELYERIQPYQGNQHKGRCCCQLCYECL